MLNKFLVSAAGPHTVVLGRVHPRLTREDALNLVAWISVLANLTDDELTKARRAVENDGHGDLQAELRGESMVDGAAMPSHVVGEAVAIVRHLAKAVRENDYRALGDRARELFPEQIHIQHSTGFYEAARDAVAKASECGGYDRAMAMVVAWVCRNQQGGEATLREWEAALAEVAKLWAEANALRQHEPRL
jgi:hypothetical protein